MVKYFTLTVVCVDLPEKVSWYKFPEIISEFILLKRWSDPIRFFRYIPPVCIMYSPTNMFNPVNQTVNFDLQHGFLNLQWKIYFIHVAKKHTLIGCIVFRVDFCGSCGRRNRMLECLTSFAHEKVEVVVFIRRKGGPKSKPPAQPQMDSFGFTTCLLSASSKNLSVNIYFFDTRM